MYPHLIKRKQQDLTLNTFHTQLCSLLPEFIVPLKRTKRLTLECPVTCHQITKAVAAAMGITVGELVYHVMRRYITELAVSDPKIKAIRMSLCGNADIDDLPPDICTYEQKEEMVNATTHKLPWE